MKLIKPSYEILTKTNGEEILKIIELAARTCYKSEDKIVYDSLDIPIIQGDEQIGEESHEDYYAVSARSLIKRLIESGHHAMLEFGGMITVKFTCDRGVSHELVRHRLATFAQESTRYCNYSKGKLGNEITYIAPEWLLDWDIEAINKGDWHNADEDAIQWANCMKKCEDTYMFLLTCPNHWTPQEARSVLPNSLKTEINVSANIREWREILKQRTSKAAHPQMRELMVPLLKDFKERYPILFDDIIC